MEVGFFISSIIWKEKISFKELIRSSIKLKQRMSTFCHWGFFWHILVLVDNSLRWMGKTICCCCCCRNLVCESCWHNFLFVNYSNVTYPNSTLLFTLKWGIKIYLKHLPYIQERYYKWLFFKILLCIFTIISIVGFLGWYTKILIYLLKTNNIILIPSKLSATKLDYLILAHLLY